MTVLRQRWLLTWKANLAVPIATSRCTIRRETSLRIVCCTPRERGVGARSQSTPELRKSTAYTLCAFLHQSALLDISTIAMIADLMCSGSLGHASTTDANSVSNSRMSAQLPGLLLVSWGCSPQSVGVGFVRESSCGFVNRRSTVRIRSVALIPLARKCRFLRFFQFRRGFPARCNRAPIVHPRLRPTPRVSRNYLSSQRSISFDGDDDTFDNDRRGERRSC